MVTPDTILRWAFAASSADIAGQRPRPTSGTPQGQIEHEMIPPGAHQAGVQLLGSQQIEFPINSDDEHVQAGVIGVQAQLWARVGIVVHLVVHLRVSLVER